MIELNFLGLETRKYMFYHQINDTTFFLAYFLTLEYILETFRAQLTNIFKKNARGGEKRVCFFPPVSNISRFAHDVIGFLESYWCIELEFIEMKEKLRYYS